MRLDLERRLRRLEIAYARSNTIEIWIEQGDGTLCCTSGGCMTREAFYRLHPPGSDDVFVINAIDARL
jgi:hypothetical protein